jgi:hypothetical protein
MATETSKHSSSTATVGDGGQVKTPRKLHFKRGNLKIKKLLFFLIAAAVIAIGWGLFNNYTGNAVFKINGKRYSHAQVKQLAAYQVDKQHIAYKTAAKNVYNALCYQVAAQSLHITVTAGAQKRASINVDAATYNKYKTWIDILAYNGAVKTKLPPASKDGAKGYAYVLWFGDAVQPSYDAPSSKYGNQQAYKADQQYAQGRANYYHDQLKNKKMTPDQVLTAVRNDPKLAPRGLAPSDASRVFGTDTYQTWQDQLRNNTIASYVKSASDNSLSSIMTDTTATKLGLDPGQYVDAYYYFVLVQKAHIPNITQQLNDKLSSLNAKYYGV